MRIALLTPVFRPAVGGMERFAEDLADWLGALGHEVTVITKTSGDPDGPSVPYRLVRIGSWRDAGPLLRRADVVHVNGLSIRASLAAAAAGKRAVVTHAAHQAICPVGIAWGPGGDCAADGSSPGPCSSCFRRGAQPWANVRAQRLAAHLAAANACISRYLERRLAVPRSTVIYNPVSADAFDGERGPAAHDLAFVGRLAQEKGVALLLRALAQVPDARLAIVGDGPQRQELEALVRDLGLAGRVELMGSRGRPEVLEVLRRSSLACVPTTCEEAFGYAAAEAMAVGTPVAATPSGALPELLADGRGFVAPGMAPEDLAQVIRTALTDQRESSARAARAEAFARDQLHIDATGPSYVALYERCRG